MDQNMPNPLGLKGKSRGPLTKLAKLRKRRIKRRRLVSVFRSISYELLLFNNLMYRKKRRTIVVELSPLVLITLTTIAIVAETMIPMMIPTTTLMDLGMDLLHRLHPQIFARMKKSA